MLKKGNIMKLILKYKAVCSRNHWMTPNASPEILCYQREFEINDINEVKFQHTDIERGIFSDTTKTYDAVQYDGIVFALRYDLKEGTWVGVCEWQSPAQQMYGRDYGRIIREKFRQMIDWKIVNA